MGRDRSAPLFIQVEVLGPNGNTSNRNVSLKWLLVSVGLVAVMGIAAWWWQSSECHRMSAQYDQYLRESASRSAEMVGRAIGTFGNRQIVAGNWEVMQEYADELVRAKSVAYVAILNREGIAIVHTNRSFRGSKLREPRETENAANASVPVMNLTRQVATIQVGVNVNRR